MIRFEVRVAALLRMATGVVLVTVGYGKVTGDFVRGGFAKSASEMAGHAWPFWETFLRRIVLPNAGAFGWAVALGELATGLGLLLGLFTRTAAICGSLLVFTILLGQSYVPGSSWDAWVTAGMLTKFCLLLLLLLAVVPAGEAWSLDALRRNRGPRSR